MLKFEALARELEATQAELETAERKLAVVAAGPDVVWRWQGDGLDHPESLSCPVVMSAETLRAILGERTSTAMRPGIAPPEGAGG